MRKKLEEILGRYQEVQRLVSDPNILGDQKRYKELMQENAVLTEIADKYEDYKKIEGIFQNNPKVVNPTSPFLLVCPYGVGT